MSDCSKRLNNRACRFYSSYWLNNLTGFSSPITTTSHIICAHAFTVCKQIRFKAKLEEGLDICLLRFTVKSHAHTHFRYIPVLKTALSAWSKFPSVWLLSRTPIEVGISQNKFYWKSFAIKELLYAVRLSVKHSSPKS